MVLERLRATTVTQAKIAKESAEQDADANLYTQTKHADNIKYTQAAEAEAKYFRAAKDADAAMYCEARDAAIHCEARDAEAALAAREKEAQAMYLMKKNQAEATCMTTDRKARADHLARKKEAAGLIELANAYSALGQVLGTPQGLMQYMMLQNGTYQDLAKSNAVAIQGLQPKSNVWQTGAQEGEIDAMAPIWNQVQALPPLLSTIADQTWIKPPSRLAQMPSAQEVLPNGCGPSHKLVNGEEVDGIAA